MWEVYKHQKKNKHSDISTISVGRTCDDSEKGRLILHLLKEKEEKKKEG